MLTCEQLRVGGRLMHHKVGLREHVTAAAPGTTRRRLRALRWRDIVPFTVVPRCSMEDTNILGLGKTVDQILKNDPECIKKTVVEMFGQKHVCSLPMMCNVTVGPVVLLDATHRCVAR